MIVLKDRVKQIASAPVPTGTLTLGTTPNSYRSFSSVLSSGDETYYAIETSNSFEVGIGRYGIEGSNTLTRDTVLSSSTGSKLSLTGRATVFITVPAAKFPFVDPSGELNLSLNTLSDVSLTTPASGESLKYNGSSWVNGIAAGYTTEEAQDAVGGILTDTSSVSFSYNDGTPSISASVKNSGVTNDMLATGIDATKIGSGSVSSIEFGYLDGVTSSLQGQLDSKYDSTNPSGYLTESGASGIYVPLTRTINTLALSANQTFAAGTSGTDFAIASSGTTHTFSIPDAGASARGLVTTGTQTIAGTKTLVGDLLFTDATYDIGKSGATRPRDGFLSRNLTVGSLLTTSTINMPSNANVSTGGITGGTSYGLYFANNGTSLHYAHNGASIFSFGSFAPHYGGTPTTAVGFGFGATSTAGDIFLQRDAAGILAQRNSTNAQTFRVYNTYTSSTSFENLQFKANAGAAYQIGSAIGSAGGSNRDLNFGSWDTAATFASSFYVGSTYAGINDSKIFYVGTSSRIEFSALSSLGSPAIRFAWGGGSPACVYGGSNTLGVGINGFTRLLFGVSSTDFTGSPFTISNTAVATGAYTGFTFTGAAHTNQTASTEATMVNWNLAQTVQFATGALTTQRAMRIQAPTYSFVGASTITTASTLSISGPPVAGTNATITNAYALNVESGNANFQGIRTTGISSASGYDLVIGQPTLYYQQFGGHLSGLQMGSALYVGWSSSNFNPTTADTMLYRDAAGTLAQRNSTNAQTFRVYNTYTSSTSFENGQLNWTSNEFRIGVAIGSAGGTTRSTVIGTWNSAGTWTPAITVASTGTSTFANTLYVPAFSGMVIGNDVIVARDTTRTIELRSSTSAVTFAISNTYTSTTSYERINIRGKASANFEIGPENGSAGGTLRGLTLGCYPAGTSTIVGWAQFRPNASTGAIEEFYLGPIADSTATGGNARGANSVDLQILRTGATQVAAGARSFLAGARSIASGADSYVIGNDCAGSGQYSIAFGTFCNSTNYAAVSFGINGAASGNQSLALSMGNGGTANALKAFICGEGVSSAQNAWATGFGVLADRQGMSAYSQGYFAANGDAQKVDWILRKKTTDATPVNLFADGSSVRLTIPSGKTMSGFLIVKGIKSDGSAKARFVRLCDITNVGGTTALDTPIEAIGTDYNPSGCVLAVTAENATDDLQINITGPAGETWRWTATFSGLEIAYGS